MSIHRIGKYLLCTIMTILFLSITVYFPLAKEIESVFPLLLIPAMLWGIYFGSKAGIMTGGFFSLYTFLFIFFVLKERSTLPYVLIAVVVLTAVSYIIGKLSDLYRKTRKQEQENKLLLRELQHRVKNNLQIMANIVYLQAETMSNEDAQNALRETYTRIMSMFDIYNELFRSAGHTRISIGTYMHNIKNLYENEGTEIDVRTEDVTVDSETAVTLGIITNELITNAAKYAFPDGSPGMVSVCFEKVNGSGYALSITDNGVGLPKGFSPDTCESFGFSLVKTLTDQLNGTLSVETSKGTMVTVRFPADSR